MKGNYFLNPRNYFWNPGNYFLNPRNYFVNPGNYFLNPGNYFLIWAPTPETIYRTSLLLPIPTIGQGLQPITWSPEIPPQKTQVNRVLTKRERLPGCWCRCSSFCFVLCSSTSHLRIRHSYFLTIQSVNSFHAISSSTSIFVNLSYIYQSLLVYCVVWWFQNLKQNKGITETVSNRFRLLSR